MDILVIGSGGLAREFSNFFSTKINIVGYSAVSRKEYDYFRLNGKFFGSSVFPDDVGTNKCIIAIGDTFLKQTIATELKEKGFEFPNFIHESVVSGTKLDHGSAEGVVISPNCVLGSNIKLGSQKPDRSQGKYLKIPSCATSPLHSEVHETNDFLL